MTAMGSIARKRQNPDSTNTIHSDHKRHRTTSPVQSISLRCKTGAQTAEEPEVSSNFTFPQLQATIDISTNKKPKEIQEQDNSPSVKDTIEMLYQQASMRRSAHKTNKEILEEQKKYKHDKAQILDAASSAKNEIKYLKDVFLNSNSPDGSKRLDKAQSKIFKSLVNKLSKDILDKHPKFNYHLKSLLRPNNETVIINNKDINYITAMILAQYDYFNQSLDNIYKGKTFDDIESFPCDKDGKIYIKKDYLDMFEKLLSGKAVTQQNLIDHDQINIELFHTDRLENLKNAIFKDVYLNDSDSETTIDETDVFTAPRDLSSSDKSALHKLTQLPRNKDGILF